MAPFAWASAGSASFNNVTGIDPELVDPDNGDYRLQPGSPAEGYGCQTFSSGRVDSQEHLVFSERSRLGDRSEVLEVSGSISADTTWDADTVLVVGDVSVEKDVTLTIAPGSIVEFKDYYSLTVDGTLLAVGTPGERIRFTTDEPQDFLVDSSLSGCWNGIRFENTEATNAPSRLSWCILEYSKAIDTRASDYPYGGGAVSVIDTAGLTVDHCVFRNNVADYGGAIFLYRHANPRIIGNLIVDNHVFGNGSAIYCAYSYPIIANNTIVRNRIHNLENPYIESCAVLNFLSKPVLSNNIVRDNDPDTVYMYSEVIFAKDYYTHGNNIEAYAGVGDNIDVDPLFVDPDGEDDVAGTSDDNFRLEFASPCVDAGLNEGVPGDLLTDNDGRSRIIDGDYDASSVVDIGAFERGRCDCDGNGVVDVEDYSQFDQCMTGPGSGMPVGCECFDLDQDADVDMVDFAGFQAVFPGE